MPRDIDNLRAQLGLIACQLDAAGHGGKSAIAAAHAKDLGISVATLYAKLKREIGWESGRKTRADKGSTSVPQESLDFIAATQKTSRRKNGKLVLHTPMATALAVQHGLDVGVTASRVQALLKARAMDAETQAQNKPHVTMRSLHPNHVHMVDPSLCLVYYMNGRQHIVREDLAYKNKPEALAKIKLKVWRYVLVDHTSNWICVAYFEAKGETQDSLFRFLMHAWSKVGERVFWGVPLILMMDPGSANTAHAIKNLCRALDVELAINLPGRPWAKGSVEVAQNIVETHFEALLKFDRADTVEALNEEAFAWCNAFNANLIPGYDASLNREGLRKKQSRTDIFLDSAEAHRRECPPLHVCAQLMRGAEVTRKVSNGLSVSYRHPGADAPQRYDLRDVKHIRAGEAVRISPLVYGKNAVLITFERYDGAVYEHRVEPTVGYDQYGFPLDAPVFGESYQSLPKTDIERDGERLDEIAYGVDADGVIRDRKAIEKAKADSTMTPFLNWCEGEGLKPMDAIKGIKMPTYLPLKGTPITVNVPPVMPVDRAHLDNEANGMAIHVAGAFNAGRGDRLSVPQLAKRLKEDLGEWDALRYSQLAEKWPEGAFDDEYNAVLSWFSGRGRMQVVK